MDTDQATVPTRLPETVEPEPTFEGEHPDVYADSVQIGMGPYGLALSFALTDINQPSRRRYVTTVRMSPQLAFSMVQLLRKALREVEALGLGIRPPKELMDAFKMDEEL